LCGGAQGAIPCCACHARAATERRIAARHRFEERAGLHPGVVLVEMGWPAAWRPLGVQAYVATYGAGQVNARAATERLLTPGSG
jgi:hypothetical protein